MLLKRIVFTVTNDLCYDQRMQRICTTLAKVGYDVLLIGRKLKDSKNLNRELYQQKRFFCFFSKGLLFYAEYNLRLFFYLLFIKADATCAIDLDTILPCYFVSMIRKKKRVYDAHELFTEMKEVISRPGIKKIWMKIEKIAVPSFQYGYTVSQSIAEEFKQRYKVVYEVIRNVPVKKKANPPATKNSCLKIIIYQGAVNEARGLENLILAMEFIEAELHIYGDGNIYKRIETLIVQKGLREKIILKGKLSPEELKAITGNAEIGINLVEPYGLNQVYSLANKFFDYIHASVPQVTMDFPEYKKINDAFEVAILIPGTGEKEITNAINQLLNDPVLYKKLKNNCIAASEVYNWQQEEKKLIEFYAKIFTE